MRFSSVFFSVLQIFSPEISLICDQVWTNVGAYDSKYLENYCTIYLVA